ncbi:MAG: SemiSWEET transporter [Candidatus Sumerlaeia bacterium]|nr:SemiSWEET transporter [Candidatus Sumerlaeia bacterium]
MDEIAPLLGTLAGTCTTVAFIPQVMKTWKTRDVEGIHPGMFLIFALGVASWLAYGIALQLRPVILFNAATLALVLAQLWMMMKFRKKDA